MSRTDLLEHIKNTSLKISSKDSMDNLVKYYLSEIEQNMYINKVRGFNDDYNLTPTKIYEMYGMIYDFLHYNENLTAEEICDIIYDRDTKQFDGLAIESLQHQDAQGMYVHFYDGGKKKTIIIKSKILHDLFLSKFNTLKDPLIAYKSLLKGVDYKVKESEKKTILGKEYLLIKFNKGDGETCRIYNVSDKNLLLSGDCLTWDDLRIYLVGALDASFLCKK